MTSSSQKKSEIAIRNELQNLMHKNN